MRLRILARRGTRLGHALRALHWQRILRAKVVVVPRNRIQRAVHIPVITEQTGGGQG